MLTKDSLKDLLHEPSLSRRDQLLLCLAYEPSIPKKVKRIKAIAVDCGLRAVNSWNVSNILAGSKGQAIRTPEGWELTSPGKDRVREIAGPLAAASKPKAASNLRVQLTQIEDPTTRSFVDEAISALEHGLYRAAIVLSWIGAVSVLYKHVVDDHLGAFNIEATRRNSKWRAAKNRDGLARMKESEFLDVLEAISVIGKSVKDELKAALKLRNGCGHPNSLKIGESRASAHIEVLILNVFGQYES